MSHPTTEAWPPARSTRSLGDIIRNMKGHEFWPFWARLTPPHATRPREEFPVTQDFSATPGEPGQEGPASTAGTGIDTTVPHSARIWNYWLGGKDNYAVDRDAGDQYKAIFPGIAVVARTSRGFLTRAVRYLAGEAGSRHFLDIGTGLPTADNIHQVAQRVAPGSKLDYVDNDPLVLRP